MEAQFQMNNSTTKSHIISGTLGAASLFVIWVLISSLQENNFIFPSVGEIFKSLINSLSEPLFWSSFLYTIIRIFIVLLASLFLSIFLSFIYVWKKTFFTYFRPLIFLMKATPLAIISVYLWISLGADSAPYLITFLMIFPVSIEGFITALDQISSKYENMIKLENRSIFTKYFRLYLPMIFPFIIMTILQTFGMSLKVMIMGEYICQTKKSIGVLIYNSFSFLEMDVLISVIISVVIIVVIWELFIKKIEKKYI